jgi:hypothetical protein
LLPPALDFGPWTIKQNQFAIQPPLEILKNISNIILGTMGETVGLPEPTKFPFLKE